MMPGPIKTAVTLGLAQKRALLAARLREAAREPRQSPLSFAQQRLWFLDQLEPNSPLYNIWSVAQINGRVDLAALEGALDAVVARHETLRTRFDCPDETPIQIIDAHQKFQLRLVDLSSQSQDERENQAARLVKAELNRPFNLSNEHSLRATLIRIEPEAHRLVLILHHIVGDEWSLRVLFQELAAFYAGFVGGNPVLLPDLPIQYADYARWQRQWLQGDILQRQLDYWKTQLRAYPPVTELPADNPRGTMPSFNGRTSRRLLGRELSERLRELARKREATQFMVLLAAFKILVHRYTQQDDLIICCPVAGRNRLETEGLIGFFVNTLALRTSLAGDPNFDQLLARVREVSLGAMAHQDLPFDRVVEELQPERTLTHLPFTKLMFTLQNGIPEQFELPGARLEFLDVEPDSAKFEITLTMRQTREGLQANLEYNRDLFEPDTIDRLLGHFETLLHAIVESPGVPISQLALLTSAEKHQLLVEWNTTNRAFPRERCVHELFEAQVERDPDAVAVRWANQKMTYAELNSRANQLARFLRQFDLKPDIPIGLCVERSLEMVVGILGILKVGGAYVPLDAHYPKERLAFMLEDAEVAVVLTQQRLLESVPRNGIKVVCLDADWEFIAREPRDNMASLANARNLAYIMYTSGSTGQPKGVAVPHRAVSRLVLNTDFIQLDTSDRIAQVSNISFDAATFELWGALLNGAQLVGITRDVALSPKDFAAELREQGITAMFLTAALFNQLASEAPGAFETLRTVIAGGEALDPKWVRAVLRNRPPQRLVNGYGPTENTTFTCCYTIEQLPEQVVNVPIGRPISNTTVYILDRHLNPVPIGVPGELYTGGDGLARGYWKRPELTEQKFVPNPFDGEGASRLYRTGDLARYRADGTIEFLGRIDDQVKIRGFRIELGEIETLLGRHPAVRECVVTVTGTDSANKRLVAYVAEAPDQSVNASELRSYLMKQLPDYMIPSAFVRITAVPLTPNGKLDRKALPAPDQTRPKLDRQYAGPRDSTESQLVAIWESILGVRPVGIQDKFFDLGGHSMLAVRVIAQIEKIFGKKLRLATLFQAPTIERLSAVLREEIKECAVAAGTSLVEIQGSGSHPPLFLVHGAGGGMFWGYINLARCLGNDQPVYGFKSRGLDGREEFTRIQELAANYVADLRKIQAHGPYYLGGYCFGGNVAYEMACQLSEQGEKIALLAVLNCAPPNSRYTRIPWTPRWALRFGRNLLYWANYFRHWSTTQRQEFFRWKWQLLKKRLTPARGSSTRDLSKVEPGDLVDLSSYTEDQKLVWETHIRALVNFQPRRYSGQIHLFRSPGHPLWCSFDEDYGWGDLAMGGVQLITVPGAHEKILEDPWVKALADQMSQALQRARETITNEESGQSILRQHPELNGAPGAVESSEPSSLPRQSMGQPVSEEEEKRQLGYWKNQLSGVPELLDLPTDRPRPAQADDARDRYSFDLPVNTGRAVSQLCSAQNAEPFSVFLPAFSAVLYRYTGTQCIVVGSSATMSGPGAPRHELQNPIALCCDLSGDPAFNELIRRSTETVKAALANSAVPFGRVVSVVCRCKSPSYAPIFQVAISCEAESVPQVAGGSRACTAEIDTQSSKLDLSLRITQGKQGFSGYVEFRTALFDRSRISRLIGHWLTLIESAAAQASQRLSELDLLPPSEARQILVEWNATDLEFPKNKTLADLFREQALSTPNAEALIFGEIRLTYAQLYKRATDLAGRLRALGVTSQCFVGICLERSPEMVAAILGTILAGGAYVPLDPKYPKDRLAFSLEDARCKVVVTQSRLLPTLPRTETQVLCLDSDETLANSGEGTNIEPVSNTSGLAYLIYTSGSTGKPKGVALEHRNAVAFVYWARATFSPEELCGVLASTSICFDLSVFELFVPLCSGGKVILADNALSLPTLAALNEVRLINTVPSAIRELLRLRAVPECVQVINLAGEPLSAELVDQIYKETSVRKVYDLYGPTETTTYSTGGLRKANQPATIGRPLSNEQVYLLDANLRPVPIGIAGELFIGGAGVARGYLNRPELTAQKFIASPFQQGARLYRTGDLARWRADGNLEYLGRMDHQVKIRGFRIELGEIENVLKSCAGVAATVVVSREDQPGDKRLAAYVVRNSGVPFGADDLKRHLRSRLPDFMVPSDFVFLAALPMTPNGKIDRKALPPPKDRCEIPRTDLVAPRNDVEEKLVGLWCEVLRLKEISVHDNFFDLGGHSLLAVRIISGIREILKIELPLSALYSAPSITALAQTLSTAATRNGQSLDLPITRVDRTAPLPVSYVQERLWFLDQLEPGSAAYNVPIALRLKGPLNTDAFRQAVSTAVSRHEALRTTFKYDEQGLTQVVAQSLCLEIPCLDVRGETSQQREQRAQHLMNTDARRPFDLNSGPLIRVTLFRLDESDHILLVTMHHAISDGWSLALFFEELATLYDALSTGQAPNPPAAPVVQYADYAHWQRRWMNGAVLEKELAYWTGDLAGAPAEIELPLDHPRPEHPSGRANTSSVRLDADALRGIMEFTRREGCTPFVFFLAALLIVLRKWTGQQDLVVGTVVAGRTRRELESMLGCFMNFLPLRARLQDGESAQTLLARVRTTVLNGQSHQDCPFEKIVEAVNPKRRRDQNPLYNVALLLQNFPPNLLQTQTLQAAQVPVSLDSALLDLRFEIEQLRDGLSLTCEYKTDLFEQATIDVFMASWLKVINQLVSSPQTAVTAFEFAPALRSAVRKPAENTELPAVVIASTFTAEPVGESLRYWLQRLDMPKRVEFAPYNQVFQQLLDPASQLSGNTQGVNVLLVRLQDWLSAHNTNGHSEQSGRSSLERSAEEFLQAAKASVTRSSTPLLISFCPNRLGQVTEASHQELDQVQRQLQADLAQIPGVYLLGSEQLASWYPVAESYDRAADELGHVPYTPVFFTALGTALARKLHTFKRPAYKVIALDCDNTLWSGVCGEDGPRGVQLDVGRQALQQFMLLQRQNGLLLCLCSKNNEEDVRAVFAARSDFPLQLNHFAGMRLNWEPKSSNLKSMSKELGLGLDSFIFIDDNPVECAEVQANCPEVLTLQLPDDPALIPQFLNHCWAFDYLKITAEDRQRGERYEQNRLREKLREEVPTLQEFLAGLELRTTIQAIEPDDYPRVAQLTQRTNQFNLTTRRRSESELRQWLNSGKAVVVRVSDRFGDYGLVGAILYQVTGQTLTVDTFLLSCRVLGRGVEHRMLAQLGEIACGLKADFVNLHFVPTAKNKPALDFLEQIGNLFKQPLNGGWVFRLPVEIASAAVLQPSSEQSSNGAGELKSPSHSPSPALSISLPSFPRCREIAMEFNDITRIHHVLAASASVRSRQKGNYTAPQSELERKLCRLWEELLRVRPVGVHDDFFELGGHSLMAVRLFAEIEKLVGRKFPLVTLFQAPTIAQLARLLSVEEGAGSLLVPIQPRGDKPPVFLVHGAGGDVLWGYANLAAHLPPDQPIYGIKSHGQKGEVEPLQIEEMARSYLEVVRTRQPQGPYFLGGYCFGGNVAYEMARQLRMQGQQVALVVLIDTAPANAGYERVVWYRPGFAWRFARNLRYWLGDFAALEPEDRRRFAGRKLRWVGRKLKRRFGLSKGPQRFDLEEVIDPGHFPEHELKLWQLHLEALIAHVERPYDGRVALLRTRGQALFCSLENDFCWGKLVKGGVLVRCIPGSHENIFMEPHVQVLGTELVDLLEIARAQNESLPPLASPVADREPVLRV